LSSFPKEKLQKEREKPDGLAGLINEYRSFFPVTDKTPVITLNEGNTPLIRAVNLGKKAGLELGPSGLQKMKYFVLSCGQ